MGNCDRGCKYWPPSAKDGKPCSACDTSEPLLSCYERRDPRKKKGRPPLPNEDRKSNNYRVRLTQKQRDQLKILAAKNGKTEAAMLRDLILKAFERS